MTDIMDQATRSRVMSMIRGQNTGPERLLRSALHSDGLRFRIHGRHLPGSPDVYFPRARVGVFVQGCFWHGCPEHYSRPRNRAAFWEEKLARTIERDAAAKAALEELGWQAIFVWEHEVTDSVDKCVRIVKAAVVSRLKGVS